MATRHRYAFCGNPFCSPKFPAAPQMVHGGRQTATLTGDLTDADMHVGRAPEHRPAFRGGEPQPPFVRAQRIAQLSLHAADLGQGDRTSQDVGKVPGPLQLIDDGR